jgi:primosomal protein N' (replication factor Y)
MGPAECALAVISGNHRRQVLLRTDDFRAAHRALATVLAGYRVPSRVYLEVDIDPVSVL